MDTEIGYCKECGGTIWYSEILNKVSCDNCDYEEVEVM